MKKTPGQNLTNTLRNSHLHYWVCRILEKFEMEGFTLSYSQCGEDLILKSIFGKNNRQGFYVDIGCNNPIQKSNTFKLYLRGWTGICVDGNSVLIDHFRKIRKKDICLTAIVSNSSREIVFYQDDVNHEMSSVDVEQANELKSTNTDLKEIRTFSTTLKDLFEKHLDSRKIDLLCVDVERHDLQVLQGNDFEKYRPSIVCAECNGNIDTLRGSEMDTFLREKNYELLIFAAPNAYYRDKALSVGLS